MITNILLQWKLHLCQGFDKCVKTSDANIANVIRVWNNVDQDFFPLRRNPRITTLWNTKPNKVYRSITTVDRGSAILEFFNHDAQKLEVNNVYKV